MIKKSVPDATNLYFLQKNKSACVLCSVSSEFYFLGDKIIADWFKDEITPSLKSNYWLKLSQDMALNHVR